MAHGSGTQICQTVRHSVHQTMCQTTGDQEGKGIRAIPQMAPFFAHTDLGLEIAN